MRVGVIGTGAIVRRMMPCFALAGVVPVAITSHSQERADWAVREYGFERGYAGRDAMLAAGGFDVVYVASIHPEHCWDALAALDAGYPVVCEKPMAVNTIQAQLMVDTAHDKGLFLMEAMWSRFLPAMDKALAWIAEGRIGDVRMVTADFGFRAEVDPDNRLFHMLKGGGAMLDVGVYALWLCMQVLGPHPAHIQAMHDAVGSTDGQTAAMLGYDDGAIGICVGATRTQTPHQAVIMGTRGRITIPCFWSAQSATLTTDEGEEIFDHPSQGEGYEYQWKHVADCLTQGLKTSPLMPVEATIARAMTLDNLLFGSQKLHQEEANP